MLKTGKHGCVLVTLLCLLCVPRVESRELKPESKQDPKPEANSGSMVTFTTKQDHDNMKQQLGITQLRPGPSGNEADPNHANYDESLANPFPKLPDPLVLNDGTPVTTAEMWWQKRRPEIVEDFEREVVGRVPSDAPSVTWTVLDDWEVELGGTKVIEKAIEGRVDNSRCPEIDVRIGMTLSVPKDAKGPVPVLMMFSGFGFFKGLGGKSPADLPKPKFPPGFAPRGPSPQQLLIEAGWGYALVSPNSVQADNGAGLTRGIIGLTNCGQPRKPDDWGALRAWAWGASRALDYLETDASVDARHVGIEGVSRYGKAALVTMAFDSRFAAALIASSGEGGAKLHRRNFGEAVESLTGSGEYHWMAGSFLKYGAAEAVFGSKNAGDLPVDAHELIALCAPRPVFISYGIPEKGDAKWLDQQGSFMATVAAGPVYRLLGAKALDVSDDHMSAKLPAVNESLLSGDLGWRQHDGGHTSGPNIPFFITWANERFAAQVATH